MDADATPKKSSIENPTYIIAVNEEGPNGTVSLHIHLEGADTRALSEAEGICDSVREYADAWVR